MFTASAILIILLQGYFLVVFLLRDVDVQLPPDSPSSTPNTGKRYLRAVRLVLIPGVGLGITSLVYFLWRTFLGNPDLSFLVFEWALTLILLALYLRSGLRPQFRRWKASRPAEPQFWKVMLITFFSLGIVGMLTINLMGSLLFPHGTFDAWMIWNLAARMLYRGGENWTNLFSNHLYHPDYPLLLGTSVARLWSFWGREAQVAAQLIAVTYALSLVALITSVVSTLRGRLTGLAAGLFVLGASSLSVLSVALTADIPLAFYMLSAVCLVYLYEAHYTRDWRVLFLAGMLAGFAAWSKNEGLLFLLALGAVRLVQYLLTPKKQRSVFPWLAFFSGLLPIGGLVTYFKLFYAPANDLVAAQGSHTLSLLLDPNRFLQVSAAYLSQLAQFDPKAGTPYILLFLFLLVAGVNRRAWLRPQNLSILALILLMASGYFLIYMVSPLDLEFHLRTSTFRLFMQLWPLAVFLTFMIVRLTGIAVEWESLPPAARPPDAPGVVPGETAPPVVTTTSADSPTSKEPGASDSPPASSIAPQPPE
jgi:hypothetical protein